MAKTSQIPFYVRLGNALTLTLLRAGFKLRGPYLVFGNYPMYLLTVRGRKSGQPRTVSLAMIERNGKRYVGSPFGIVDWVRNLRAAGEAVLTRGRRSETVTARELPTGEAALVMREDVKGGNPFARNYGVTADSSLEEFERAVVCHPLFVLEKEIAQAPLAGMSDVFLLLKASMSARSCVLSHRQLPAPACPFPTCCAQRSYDRIISM